MEAETAANAGMTVRDLFAMGYQSDYLDEIARAVGHSASTSDELTKWWAGMPLAERLAATAKLRYAFADAMLAGRDQPNT